jgi:penicillin-insensitive murein endopeptidase
MKAFSGFFFGLFFACQLHALAGDFPIDELEGIPSTEIVEISSDDSFQGDQEQAKGFYSSGNLLNPNNLPLEGFGFVKLFRPRSRGFGTFDLITLLQETSAQLQLLHPSRDRVQIGDASQEAGGRISGHVSHQNGLDVDVAFLRVDQTEQDPERTDGFREIFVRGGKLTANFDLRRNWDYAKILIGTGRVQRLFVGEVVKKEMCKFVKSVGELTTEAETMRRIRVVAGHTDHYHIRLTCPRNSPNCRAQEEVPATTGCL